jgi:hypothetical protein
MQVTHSLLPLQTFTRIQNEEAEPQTEQQEQGRAVAKKDENGQNTSSTPHNDPRVQELQAVDTAVRAHEAAHLSAGGGVVTGGANFSYQRGPDGKMYAVGGEVPIDASEGSTPDETIQKAQRIRAAALAPSDPSPQDYKVAAMAIMMEQNARLEKMRELQEELTGVKAYKESAASLDDDLQGVTPEKAS